MKNLEDLLSEDYGVMAGRFGSSPHHRECAELCTRQKIKFALDVLNEIIKYEPWGDDHADNLHLTLKLIKEMRVQLEESIEKLMNS